jgi:hypothetical protein
MIEEIDIEFYQIKNVFVNNYLLFEEVFEDFKTKELIPNLEK